MINELLIVQIELLIMIIEIDLIINDDCCLID